jgi:hypothetical protein
MAEWIVKLSVEPAKPASPHEAATLNWWSYLLRALELACRLLPPPLPTDPPSEPRPNAED